MTPIINFKACFKGPIKNKVELKALIKLIQNLFLFLEESWLKNLDHVHNEALILLIMIAVKRVVPKLEPRLLLFNSSLDLSIEQKVFLGVS